TLLTARIVKAFITGQQNTRPEAWSYLVAVQDEINGSWSNDVFVTAEVMSLFGLALPNLLIQESSDPYTPDLLQWSSEANVTIRVDVRNNGLFESGETYLTAVLDNGENSYEIDRVYIPTLQSGETHPLHITTLEGVLPVAGENTLTIMVDPNNYVEEINERDNQLEIEVLIHDPALLSVENLTVTAEIPPDQIYYVGTNLEIDFDIVNSGGVTVENSQTIIYAVNRDDPDLVINLSLIVFSSLAPGSTTGPTPTPYIIKTGKCPHVFETGDNNQIPPGEWDIVIEILPGDYDLDVASQSQEIEVEGSLDIMWHEPNVLYNCEGTMISNPPYNVQAGDPVFVFPLHFELGQRSGVTVNSPPGIYTTEVACSWASESDPDDWHNFATILYDSAEYGITFPVCLDNGSFPSFLEFMLDPDSGDITEPDYCNLGREIPFLDTSDLASGGYTIKVEIDPDHLLGEDPGDFGNNVEFIDFEVTPASDLIVVENLTEFFLVDQQIMGRLTVQNDGIHSLDLTHPNQPPPDPVGGDCVGAVYLVRWNNGEEFLKGFNNYYFDPGETIAIPDSPDPPDPPDYCYFGTYAPAQYKPIIRVRLDEREQCFEGLEGEANNIVDFYLELPDYEPIAIESITTTHPEGTTVQVTISNIGDLYQASSQLQVEFIKTSDVPTPEPGQKRSPEEYVYQTMYVTPPAPGSDIVVLADINETPCGNYPVFVRINSDLAITESDVTNNESLHVKGIGQDPENCDWDCQVNSDWTRIANYEVFSEEDVVTIRAFAAYDGMNHEPGDHWCSSRKVIGGDFSYILYHTEILPENILDSGCFELNGEDPFCASEPRTWAQEAQLCYGSIIPFEWKPMEAGYVGDIPIFIKITPDLDVPDINPNNNIAVFEDIISVKYYDFFVDPDGFSFSRENRVQGQPFDIRYRVGNRGNLDPEPSAIQLEVILLNSLGEDVTPDGVFASSVTLGANQVLTLTAELNLPYDTYSLNVFIDSNNQFTEYFDLENNNMASVTFEVMEPVDLIAEAITIFYKGTPLDDPIIVLEGYEYTVVGKARKSGTSPIDDVMVLLRTVEQDPELEKFERMDFPDQEPQDLEQSWQPRNLDNNLIELVVDSSDEVEESGEGDLNNTFSLEIIVDRPPYADLSVLSLDINEEYLPNAFICQGDFVVFDCTVENTGMATAGGIEPPYNVPINIIGIKAQDFPDSLAELATNWADYCGKSPFGTLFYDPPLEILVSEPPGNRATREFSFDTDNMSGNYYLVAFVDPENAIDEIWEDEENIKTLLLTINPGGNSVAAARRSGLEWLINHQRNTFVDTTADSGLEATYFRINSDYNYNEMNFPVNINYMDMAMLYEAIHNMQYEQNPGSYNQMPFAFSPPWSPANTEKMAVFYKGYINIPELQESGQTIDNLDFIIENADGTDNPYQWAMITINNRPMTFYNYERDPTAHSWYWNWNAHLTDVRPGYHYVEIIYFKNIGNSGPETTFDPVIKYILNGDDPVTIDPENSNWDYKPGSDYNFSLWSSEASHSQVALAAIVESEFRKAHGDGVFSTYYPSMTPHLAPDESYFNLIEFIINSAKDANWDQEGIYSQAYCIEALAKFCRFSSDYPSEFQSSRVDFLRNRILGDSNSLPGSEDSLLFQALANMNKKLWQAHDGPWDEGWFDYRFECNGIALHALASISSNPSEWDDWGDQFQFACDPNDPDDCVNMFEAILNALTNDEYISDTTNGRYWGIGPNDPATPWHSYSPMLGLSSCQNLTGSQQTLLHDAAEYLPEGTWGYRHLGDHLNCFAHAMYLEALINGFNEDYLSVGAVSTAVKELITCRQLFRILSRQLPNGSFSAGSTPIVRMDGVLIPTETMSVGGVSPTLTTMRGLLRYLEYINNDSNPDTLDPNCCEVQDFHQYSRETIIGSLNAASEWIADNLDLFGTNSEVIRGNYEEIQSSSPALQALIAGANRFNLDDPEIKISACEAATRAVGGILKHRNLTTWSFAWAFGSEGAFTDHTANLEWAIDSYLDSFAELGMTPPESYTFNQVQSEYQSWIYELKQRCNLEQDDYGWSWCLRGLFNEEHQEPSSLHPTSMAANVIFQAANDPIALWNSCVASPDECSEHHEYLCGIKRLFSEFIPDQFSPEVSTAFRTLNMCSRLEPVHDIGDFPLLTSRCEALQRLIQSDYRSGDHGWNFSSDSDLPGETSATAMAILALNEYLEYSEIEQQCDTAFEVTEFEIKKAVIQGMSWLIAAQQYITPFGWENENGGWGPSISSPLSDTHNTAYATWALNAIPFDIALNMSLTSDKNLYYPGETVNLIVAVDQFVDQDWIIGDIKWNYCTGSIDLPVPPVQYWEPIDCTGSMCQLFTTPFELTPANTWTGEAGYNAFV
ncbi:hypothetical protein K8T06_07770, partial [bacterium]|nr:hypothetical protein [bacterium]